ncbi:SRPBCC family protein [Bradyrhizobium sp. 18BD]
MTESVIKIDPKLDLVLEREVDVPVELIWKAWTSPEHLRHWFAPKPWTITSCDLDVRPGGAINFTMRGPDGQEFPNTQSYLEVTPCERLIMTDALLPGYRPSPRPFFTAVLELTRRGPNAAHYKAIAIHGNDEARKSHEQMGFEAGWGTVVKQMVEYIKAGRMQ